MPENATLYGDGTHPNQCIQYGSFMKHLSRGQAEGVFWGMFMVVVILLVVAATVWAESEKLARALKSAENELECMEHGASDDIDKTKEKLRSKQKNSVRCTAICALLATISTVMGAFAALTVQWCWSENLINLYWSFWILISVGSCIAMIGIAISHYFHLNDHDHPPWNIALGTPVLVIAGIGTVFHTTFNKLLGCRASKEEVEEKTETSPLGIDTEVKRVIRGAALLGMDYENRPVISFPKDFEAGNLAQDAKLIGFTTEGGPIIRFSKHYESISRCITRRQDSEETVLQLSSTPRSDPPQQESNPLDSSQENSNTGSR